MGQPSNQRRNLKIYGNKRKWKHNNPNTLGRSEGSPERKIHCNPGLPQETRKIPNQNLRAHLLEIEAEPQRHPKPSRRRQIVKIRAKIKNIESKKNCRADQ